MLFSYEKIQSLSESELEVYHCILELENRVLDMKIRELAKLAHVSVTVIWNFCKKMECDGWTEFKIKYKENLLDKKADYELNEDEQVNKYIVYSHNETEKERKKLDQVMLMMREAQKIIFIGAGMSSMMAKYGAMYLTNAGRLAHYVDTSFHSIYPEEYTGTVVISLSVSGETPSIVDHSARFKDLGAKIVSITNKTENELAQIADVALFYENKREEILVLGPRNTVINVNATTQIPTMYLIEMISKGCVKNI